MTFLQRYWSQIALFVAGIIIAFLIFGKCNSPSDHSAELKALKDSAAIFKTVIGQQNAEKSNFIKQLAEANKANDSLSNKIVAAKI